MTPVDAIERRVSVRAYDPRRLEAADLDAIRDAGISAPALTASEMRFVLDADGTAATGGMTGIVGDYGRYIVAPHYLVLAATEADGYLADAGWRLEHAVVEATRRGVGTCWIGGMFSEPKMEEALGLPGGMRVIALTPLGHAATSGAKGLLQRGVRAMFRGSGRKPVDQLWSWEQPGTALPPAALDDPSLARWIEAVRRAPSWANKQPWRLVLSAREMLLYKAGEQLKDGKDYHLVDCGIAMAHAAIAGRELGLNGTWSLDPAGLPDHPDGFSGVARYTFDEPLTFAGPAAITSVPKYGS